MAGKRNQRVRLSDEMKARLLDANLIPDEIEVAGIKYRVLSPVRSGVSGAVWRCQDRHGRPRAIKLAIKGHYDTRSYMEEVSRAAVLEEYEVFARFIDAGPVRAQLKDGSTIEFVAFVEEWVNGITIGSLLEEYKDLHTVAVLRAFVHSFCSVLDALETESLYHDDLNPGNIMLKQKRGGLDDVWTVKVIDMASLKSRRRPSRKPRDDHRWFVEHLVGLWNCIQKNPMLSISDRRFLAEAERIMRLMLDEDSMACLTDPEQIRDEFNAAYTRSQVSQRSEEAQLENPFDFISAEYLWDDRLLVRLFAESCPWLHKVISPDPCLLTGPRGCGKSTIFRWLSLKAQLVSYPKLGSEYFEELKIYGFYISCSNDLQNKVAWIKTTELANQFEREIVHYFNLLVTREVMQTLILIADRVDRETYWGLGETQERDIHRFVLETIRPRRAVRIQGVSHLAQLLDVIESEIFAAYADFSRHKPIPNATTTSFLGDLTDKLIQILPRFREKRVAFLIDDYSVHRIPDPVQVVLNKVIWERRDSHVFKLSSEKYGAVFHDTANATAEPDREMMEVIDCGQEFIALDDRRKQKQAIKFAKELLDNRLQEAGYDGRTDDLIGPSVWEEGSLGKALRGKPKGRKNDQYHGIECIAQLCSGDVSTLLLIYRRIFSEGGVSPQSTKRISKAKQHKAIRSVSQRMLERIKTYHPLGESMYKVVNQFGTLVRRILDEGKMISQGEDREEPPQCPRIEIDQKEGAVVDQLAPDDKKLAHELVRRAVFIEMEPGLSRHKNVTTLRWQLRRVLLPAFNASLAKNDAVKRDPDWFKYFMTNPHEACELELLNRRPPPNAPLFEQQH